MWKNGCRIARTSQKTSGIDALAPACARAALRDRRVIHRTLAYPSGAARYSSAGLEQSHRPHPDVSEAPSAARSPQPSGRSSSRWTNSCSAAATTTSSCSVGRSPAAIGWYSAGLVLHMQNGALFGAVYANIAPALPLPPALRGPAFALAEHLVLWPLASCTDRCASGARGAADARRQPPGVRPGHLAPSPVRVRARRTRASPERRARAGAAASPRPTTPSNGHGSLEHGVYAASSSRLPV